MGWFSAPGYWLGRLVFLRALAVIYLIAFLVAASQFRPLLGDDIAMFLGNDATDPPLLVLLLIRWLLLRLEFGAGLIKMRGGACWRDLTCLYYHHETQPMPGPFSWRFHHLPNALHRVEVAANHVAQLGAPVLLFAPQPVASVAAVAVIATQSWLVLSGNFSWLNVITITLAIPAISHGVLHAVIPLAQLA